MHPKYWEKILLNHRFHYINHQKKFGKTPNENILKEYQRVLDWINNQTNNIDFKQVEKLFSPLGVDLDKEVAFTAQHTHPINVVACDIGGSYWLKFSSSNNKAIAFFHILYENVKIGELVPSINKENFCKALNITREEFSEIYDPNGVLIRNKRTRDWGENGNIQYYNTGTLDENGKSSKISQVIYYIPHELLYKYSNKFKYPFQNIENISKDTKKFISDLPNLLNLEVYNFGTDKYEKFDKNAIEFSDIEKTHQAIVDQCASNKLTMKEILILSFQAKSTSRNIMAESSLENLCESNSRPINYFNTLNKDGNWLVGGRDDWY